jgi:hypothetical protein
MHAEIFSLDRNDRCHPQLVFVLNYVLSLTYLGVIDASVFLQ